MTVLVSGVNHSPCVFRRNRKKVDRVISLTIGLNYSYIRSDLTSPEQASAADVDNLNAVCNVYSSDSTLFNKMLSAIRRTVHEQTLRCAPPGLQGACTLSVSLQSATRTILLTLSSWNQDDHWDQSGECSFNKRLL